MFIKVMWVLWVCCALLMVVLVVWIMELSMDEVLGEDFICTVCVKGFGEW